jgi:hypothetical protein
MQSRVRELWTEVSMLRRAFPNRVPVSESVDVGMGRMDRRRSNYAAIVEFLRNVGELVDETPEEGDITLVLLFRRWFVRFIKEAINRFWLLPVVQETLMVHSTWRMQLEREYESVDTDLDRLHDVLHADWNDRMGHAG